MSRLIVRQNTLLSTSTTTKHLKGFNRSIDADKIKCNSLFVSDKTILAGSSCFQAEDGTAAAPCYTFTSDQDSGMFRTTPGSVGISDEGDEVASFLSDGAQNLTVDIGRTVGSLTSTFRMGSGAANTTCDFNIGNGALNTVSRLDMNANTTNTITLGETTSGGSSSIDIVNDQTLASRIRLLGVANGWQQARAAGTNTFIMLGEGTFTDTIVQVNHAAGAAQGVYNTQAIGIGLNIENIPVGGGAAAPQIGLTTLDVDAGGDTITLAAGAQAGQLKTFVLLTTAGGIATITPALTLGTYTSIVLASPGDTTTLVWTGALGWAAIGYGSGVISTAEILNTGAGTGPDVV